MAPINDTICEHPCNFEITHMRCDFVTLNFDSPVLQRDGKSVVPYLAWATR